MPLLAIDFCEDDSGLLFGGGRSVPGAIGTGLNDMHHAASCLRIPADIERICSHQYPAHRLNPRVKLYLGHVARAILVSATKLRFMGSYSDALALRSARTALAYVPRGEPSKLDERG